MTRRTPSAALLLLCWGTSACMAPAESSPQGEVGDSAGWHIVQNGPPQWESGDGWTVSPEPELTIGVLNGLAEYQFVRIVDATRRSDGSLVVVDGGARSVRLYDPQGDFLKTLGGPGSGPGEFTDPGSVLTIPGDTVVVWDQSLLRGTRFGPNGELAGIRTVDWGRIANALQPASPPTGGKVAPKGKGVASGIFPGPMEPLEDGGYLVRLMEKSSAAPSSDFHRPRSGALRVSEDLTSVDTLIFFGDTEQVGVEAPWGSFSITPPGAKETRIAHHGQHGRICIGEEEESEIFCFEPDGTRTTIRWVHSPVPLTEDDLAAWREETLSLLDQKLSRDQILEILDQVPIRKFRPPYARILLDPEENLWVELGPSGDPLGSTTDFLVFDPLGILLGTVALPPVETLEIGLDYVLGVQMDDLGVEYLGLYELKKTPEGEEILQLGGSPLRLVGEN